MDLWPEVLREKNGELVMKSSLTIMAILMFASFAQAQSGRSHSMTTAGGTGYSYSGGSWGSGGGWSGWGSSSGRAVVFEPPREFAVGYAKNDGDFVPSVYMNYEDALALGRQMLADEEARAKGEGAYSLGEAARAARIAKFPTLRLKSRITQDNSGRMLVCNLNGNDCHKL